MGVKRDSVDLPRLLFLLGAAVASLFVGFAFQPRISGNKDAINAIVTIFSILAGFLVAVLTLIVDPIISRSKTWQDLQEAKMMVRRKLRRQQILFFLYLLCLGFALVTFLIPEQCVKAQKFVETFFLGMSTFVFLMSFSLPSSLIKLQMDKYEAALIKASPAPLAKIIDQKVQKSSDKKSSAD